MKASIEDGKGIVKTADVNTHLETAISSTSYPCAAYVWISFEGPTAPELEAGAGKGL